MTQKTASSASSVGLCLLSVLFSTVLSAETVKVTAKVQQRSDDGTAMPDAHVYPEAELEFGESAALHVGKDFRYRVWDEALEGSETVESLFEEAPIGLTLVLEVAGVDEAIAYSGVARVTRVNEVNESGSSLSSTQATFFGRVDDGGLVELELVDSGGSTETLALHFEKAAEQE